MSTPHFKLSNAFQIGLLGGLGVLVAILIGSMFVTLASVLTYVFAAIFIALGLDPIVHWLETRKLSRPLAITLVMVVIIAAFLLVGMAFVPNLITQAAHFVESTPKIIAGLTKVPLVKDLDHRFGGAITDALNNAGAFIADSGNWPTMLGGVVKVGLSIVNGITGGIIILILSLYFMASLKSFKQFIYQLVPASRREKFESISEQVSQAVGRYVIGQVSIAAINATAGFIFMLIVGIPYAGVLATISFLLALIPLVGSLSATVIIALVALGQSPTLALIAVVYYLIYMQIEAYVISPRVMRKAVSVPGAVVVVAALAGGTLLGVLGALVAIPVAAAVILILRQIVMPRQDEI
jgi:predicted PurR-regulated permease PerM